MAFHIRSTLSASMRATVATVALCIVTCGCHHESTTNTSGPRVQIQGLAVSRPMQLSDLEMADLVSRSVVIEEGIQGSDQVTISGEVLGPSEIADRIEQEKLKRSTITSVVFKGRDKQTGDVEEAVKRTCIQHSLDLYIQSPSATPSVGNEVVQVVERGEIGANDELPK
jgi:hypothetical protein